MPELLALMIVIALAFGATLLGVFIYLIYQAAMWLKWHR